MKLAVKILFAIFLITSAGFYYLTYGMLENIRIRYLEGVEETLVDQSRILASFVSEDMQTGKFSPENLHTVFDHAYHQLFKSKIYNLEKTDVDLRVYITDETGHILFDSTGKAKPGEDYSSWRDVYMTLNGTYGARSSREDYREQSSSVLYVAAPIMVDKQIKGVLTVAKPTTNMNSFLAMAKRKIKLKIIISLSFILILSVLAISFITQPIKRLTRYANDIRAGNKADLPVLDSSEIGDMGRAFENMRLALENRKYVEHYVQTLTHEIKSPLSAIKGAAELLEEDMPQEQRTRFLDNIRSESERIKKLVDRMLQLSSIENMTSLNRSATLTFSDIVNQVLDQMRPVLESKKLSLIRDIDTHILMNGDAYLLKQALSNLIQNSVDFSPKEGTITIKTSLSDNRLSLKLTDQGPGFPEYATEKLFDKFFSLQRPDSGKKSTGLGLNFVKEIATLHKGTIRLNNLPKGGACAELILPGRKSGS
ncbi:MAG: two-component system sensor histidine kinase CreC [Proteobacteria bacterium]|nr:two-component system sensor histidine kinase CreC [Pseudomonadota bacterium]